MVSEANSGGLGPGLVLAGEDRFGEPFSFLNGRFDCKIAGADTAGALCAFDTWRFAKGGPPLHVHHDQDEWFRVDEGEFLFQIGTEQFRLGAGDSILGPRGVPHAFTNVSETGRMLVLFQPAGTMEAFFHAGSRMGKITPGEFAALSLDHGMKVVGPPLSTG